MSDVTAMGILRLSQAKGAIQLVSRPGQQAWSVTHPRPFVYVEMLVVDLSLVFISA